MFRMYATIWRATWQRQILLIALSLLVAGLAAVPLEYQKDIVNLLTRGEADAMRLVRMCAEMFGLILLSLALKWALGYFSGTLGEDVIRRLRRHIYAFARNRSADPETPVADGTLATMISAESESLGRFTGGAISDPVLQIGTLIAVTGFIAASQPGLGIIALCIILPQIAIVLLTQVQVNRLVAQRVGILRRATDAALVSDYKAVQQQTLEDFDTIYETRRRMFMWKLSTKFGLSALGGGGTVAVLLLGGWLVLEGRTDVGTVVAAIAGLERLRGPTTYLIAFYRQVSAMRVQFDLLGDMVGASARKAA